MIYPNLRNLGDKELGFQASSVAQSAAQGLYILSCYGVPKRVLRTFEWWPFLSGSPDFQGLYGGDEVGSGLME